MPSLKVLSIATVEGKPLRESTLSDLSNAPAALEYIGWEADLKPMTLYRVVREGGKIHAVKTGPLREPNTGKKWVDQTVLDHFGDAAREW